MMLALKTNAWTTETFKKAARYWRLDWNTRAIAKTLNTDESEVWNRLDAIKALRD
jgi:hypothetical protein